MNYFKDCQTLDQAKNLFNKLVKELHPDTSGRDSHNEFIELYKQWENFKVSEPTKNDEGFNRKEFYDIVKAFDILDDVQVSFVGSFIWLEDMRPGATFEQKEKIKSIKLKGFNNARFAGKKKLWYFSPEGYKQKRKSNKNIDQIKDTWGCKSFQAQGQARLRAAS